MECCVMVVHELELIPLSAGMLAGSQAPVLQLQLPLFALASGFLALFILLLLSLGRRLLRCLQTGRLQARMAGRNHPAIPAIHYDSPQYPDLQQEPVAELKPAAPYSPDAVPASPEITPADTRESLSPPEALLAGQTAGSESLPEEPPSKEEEGERP
ncbi:hypothetical protein, partial [Cesiribacter andamanensis]|uniref:hypothetical protein n=1 Tax=Cesiribacter andamanensis TaxID=649507 RepID=UPI00191C3079